MSIVSVNEKAGRRHRLNEDGEAEYTRVFSVVTSSAADGAKTVRTATGIPRRGDVYQLDGEVDFSATAKEIEPQQDTDNPRKWEVRVEYGPLTSEAGGGTTETNPLLRPADISWGFTPYTRVAFRDINNKGILNSAGLYFDPPAEVDDSRPVLSISRNEAGFNPALAIEYQDSINSDSFFGASARQVKLAGISSTRQFENNVIFWRTNYEFHFRREGWKLALLDQGRYDNLGVPIMEKDADGTLIQGSHVADPVPLNGLGQRKENPSPTNVVYLEFDVYKERSFSALNLP